MSTYRVTRESLAQALEAVVFFPVVGTTGLMTREETVDKVLAHLPAADAEDATIAAAEAWAASRDIGAGLFDTDMALLDAVDALRAARVQP